MSGWIKLHRSLLSWEWYSDLNVFRLFTHLLLTANHEDTRWRGVVIKRGQRVSGLPKLSEETGLSVQQLRTALDKLKSTGGITVTPTAKYSIITICNYAEYQDVKTDEQQAVQQATQQAGNSQSTTSKEVKKKRSKEEEKPTLSPYSKEKKEPEERFEQFWKSYPKKIAKKDAKKAWEKTKCGNGLFDTVMEKLEQFKTSDWWTKENGKFVPNPATWINGERWNDEIHSESTSEKKIGGYTF